MDDIHGLKPFILFAPNWRPILLVAMAAAAAALALRWWRRRPRPVAAAAPLHAPPPPRAARTAAQLLGELAARKLPEAGKPREFHAQLSAIVRAWLAARFELPARRMTTTELLGALGGRAMDEAAFKQIVDLLPACDLAKFAGFRPGAPEMQLRLQQAQALVQALGDLPVVVEDDEPVGPLGAAR